ncbi:hypothetical protein PM082_023118 [Marasmius tenuissimus]|nr:hypothetical protein PM082_023118 [Marasmius tenuissimus]
MFSKTLAVFALLPTGALAGKVAPCTLDELTLHGITGGSQTAPYSRWEDAPGTDGKELHIYDKSDSTEPLCVFESSIAPSLNERSVPRSQLLAGKKRAPECFGQPCTDAGWCKARGCAKGCSTWWTPGWPGNAGQGFNSACISDGV